MIAIKYIHPPTALIAGLKPVLDWPVAGGRTVLVQFAGMSRDDVTAIGYSEVRIPTTTTIAAPPNFPSPDCAHSARSSVRAVKLPASEEARNLTQI